MRRTRSFGVVAGLMAIGMVAAGCSSSTSNDASGSKSASANKPSEINVFTIPSPSADALKKMAPLFTAKTGIKVNFSSTEYGTAHQKALLSIKSKQGAFDVVQFDNTFLPAFAYAGALAPLDDYQKSDAYDLNDFSPALQKYGTYGGKTYGLVLSTEPFITWYRKSILAKANLKAPTTWDEYQAVAKATNSGNTHGQIIGYGTGGGDWWWMQLVWSWGGQLYDKDFKPLVNSPEAVAATQYYKDLLPLAPSGALSFTGDDVTIQYASTQIAQMIQYSGYASGVFDPAKSPVAGDTAVAAVPAGKVNAVELAGWNIGIPSDAPNPDAGWQFLEFALGKENAKKMLEFGAAAIGRKSVTTDPAMLAKYPYLSLLGLDTPGLVVYPYPQLVTWPEFDKACSDGLADILTGKVSVQDGLNALNDKLTLILAKEPKG